jgi:hypothetical protein
MQSDAVQQAPGVGAAATGDHGSAETGLTNERDDHPRSRMMQLKEIHHVSINVKNVEEARG